MMVLDVFHTWFSCKMDDAAASLEALELSTYPRENISTFSNDAQGLINIMKNRYTLPYQLGSKLINKMCNTQSLYFNRVMYSVMDKGLVMEKAHGPHRDPNVLEKAANYKEYGSLGICVKMRESYSNLVTTKPGLALAAIIPAAIIRSVTGNKTYRARKNPIGMKYHDCDSDYHFKSHAGCTKTTKPPVKAYDKPTVSAGAKGIGKLKIHYAFQRELYCFMNTIK